MMIVQKRYSEMLLYEFNYSIMRFISSYIDSVDLTWALSVLGRATNLAIYLVHIAKYRYIDPSGRRIYPQWSSECDHQNHEIAV
jgi:hypothetical protein